MPRKSHSTHPDHVRTSASKPASVPITAAAEPHHFPSEPLSPEHTVADLPMLMVQLMHRSDGWLRMVPDRDNDVTWWKWKFTSGRWQGHYAMVRGDKYQPLAAVSILLRKLASIDLCFERPSKDTYFSD